MYPPTHAFIRYQPQKEKKNEVFIFWCTRPQRNIDRELFIQKKKKKVMKTILEFNIFRQYFLMCTFVLDSFIEHQ